MTEQARAALREYKRAWNRANRDKVKAAQERYWNRKAEAAVPKQAAQTETEKEQ